MQLHSPRSHFLISADIIFALLHAWICDNTRIFDKQGRATKASAKAQDLTKKGTKK